MKRKIALIITAVVMLAVTIIGGTMASFQAETSLERKISTTELGIQLVQKSETGAKTLSDGKIQHKGMPGDVVNAEMSVENTKDKPTYVRVAVSKYWVEPETNKKIFEKVTGKDENGKDIITEIDAKQIDLVRDDANDWFIYDGDEHGEVVYFYYLKPFTEETSEFMSAFTILKDSKESNAYQGLEVVLSFEAEAIQMTSADKAMLAEWGMKVELDSEGNITDIKEQ